MTAPETPRPSAASAYGAELKSSDQKIPRTPLPGDVSDCVPTRARHAFARVAVATKRHPRQGPVSCCSSKVWYVANGDFERPAFKVS